MLTSSLTINNASLRLTHAILLYQGGGDETIATTHEVVDINNKPVIQAGRLFTRADLESLHSGLNSGGKAGVAWVEPTLLAYGDGKTIWYSEPCRRTMFFKTTGTAGSRFDAQALLPVPGLVWMRHQEQLYVYAFRGTKRPDYETKLYQAPFFNVYDSGRICEGTAVKPSADAPNIAWENAFFQSRFTHPNVHERDRLIRGMNPLAFWEEMVHTPKKVFPANRLVDLEITVGDLTKTKGR